MAQAPNIDGVLIQLGDRLFYPRNRIVKVAPDPRLKGNTQQQRAAVIRDRIAATVRRAPQVMVKVTGGGRGMKAIAALLPLPLSGITKERVKAWLRDETARRPTTGTARSSTSNSCDLMPSSPGATMPC